MRLGEAIESILIESGLSVSAFSRKVGYSRQYIYELLKTKDDAYARKIQLDTLKQICDATGYSLQSFLIDIGYIPKPVEDYAPNTVIVVGKNGDKKHYLLDEHDASLIGELTKSLENER